MTQYNTLNVKLSNSQLNKLKSGIKNGTEITLKIFYQMLLVILMIKIIFQVLRLRKAFANGSSANTKLSKTQMHKIGQSGEFLGRLLGPLLKTELPLIGNVLKPLAKSVLIPLATAAAAAIDEAIHKKIFGSGNRTLIISNEEMNDIMKTS